MTTRSSLKQAIGIGALAAALIAGCGESPEAELASAKTYIAKNDNKAAVIQLRNALQGNPDLAEARFLLGKTLLATGDIPGAEKELRRALQLQYPTDQVAPLLAQVLVQLGQYKEVVAELARVQVESPQAKAELLVAIGDSHLALRNIDLAQQAFSLALTADPKHVPAHLGQARVSATKGNLADASAAVDAALAISPGDAEGLQLRGDLLLAQKQREPALLAYRKALESKPTFLPAHRAAVALLIQDNRLEDAIRQLGAMKQVAPNHPHTLYLQALLAYRQKDFIAARQALQQQLRMTPDDVRGLVLAGATEVELKTYGQAEVHLLKALDRAPNLLVARRILIVSYLRSGQATQALETLKPVIGSADRDPNMLALAGEVFLMNGQSRQASEYFSKASALDPGDARKRTAVALTHVVTGETDKGLRELEEAAASDTGTRADLALISGHMYRHEYDKALSAIAKLEKKQPGTPLPHVLRGRVALAKNDSAGARRSFDLALQTDPTYFPAAASLAQIDLAEGKQDAARQRFENLLAKDPNHMQALLALAALRAQTAKASTGAAKEAESREVVDLINKAISAHPAAPAPRLMLIRYLVGANEPNKAVAAAQAALSAMPAQPQVLDAAGRAYQAAGDHFQAVTVYRQLATLQRSSPEPYLRMAEAQWAAKNKDDAMDSLRKALALRPDLLEAQRGIIGIDLDAGRVKEAVRTARDVQKQRPKEGVGYLFEGDIHASQKNWTEAATAYRNGLAQAPSTNLASRLHSALAAGNGAADADRFAAGWLKDHPKDDAFRLVIAQASIANKDYRTGAQHYRKLLETQPNNPALLNNLAWAEGQLNDPKAIEHAEQANKLAPNQPALMDTLGMLLVQNGETKRGLDLLQKASTAAPQSPAIRLNLAKALIKAGQKDAARKELDELAKLGDKFPAQSEVTQLRQGL